MFLLYVKDLPKNIMGEIWLFSDYVSHMLKGKTLRLSLGRGSSRADGNGELDKRKFKLILNQGKTTTAMKFFNRKKPDSSPLLKLENKTVNVCDNGKYLGITISCDLRWNNHILRHLVRVADKSMLYGKSS